MRRALIELRFLVLVWRTPLKVSVVGNARHDFSMTIFIVCMMQTTTMYIVLVQIFVNFKTAGHVTAITA